MKKRIRDNVISKINTPVSREEFEHNINLLREQAEHISEASEAAINSFWTFTYPQLEKARILPNGRINLQTIDESLRLSANTKKFMESLEPFEDDNKE